MMQPALRFRAVRLASLGAVMALALPGLASAQDAYPQVEVRQITGTGGSTWASSARVSLDRDAFVVVFELGADGRARIIHPASPRDDAFMSAKRNWYVPLPSVDAMFIQASSMRTPALVAFASDVAPDLREFTSTGRSWDFMFSIPEGAAQEATLRDLAALLFGDPDMPYSVTQSRIAPMIPFAAQRALSSCGYRVGAYGSAQFNDFLWDIFGPFYGWGGAQSTITPWRTNSFVNAFDFPLGMYGYFSPLAFTRFTSSSLWNRFGAGCGGLQQLPFMRVAVLSDAQLEELRRREREAARLPKSVAERGPDGRVPDVGIGTGPTPPMTQRATRLRAAVTEANAPKDAAQRGSLTREANRELLQRAEVRAMVDRLASQRTGGGAITLDPDRRLADVRRAFQGGGASGRMGRMTRAGSGGGGSMSGSMGGGSSSVGSAGSSSSGSSSAGSSSAGRSSGGRSSSGRSGSGRGNPFE